ncbi:MAG: copper-translocating P-type ATPase [Candidatus Kapabacteria bacterium]|nr:copper-translocating P-type ATPase [Candidatus Kapabacteria bacterium]
MHCSACVSAVEQALMKVGGVKSASVNLVTNSATVELNASVSDEDLRRAVVSAGYRVEAVYSQRTRTDEDEFVKRLEAPAHEYRRALMIAAPFSLAVVLIGMSAMTGMHLDHVNELLCVLSLPVLWSGRMFFRGAFVAARHGKATMDTLVTLGTGSAFVISVLMTFMPDQFSGNAHAGAYYDSTTTIIALVLLGKWLESGAKQRTVDTLASLLKHHARRAFVVRDGHELAIDASEMLIDDVFIVRPGQQIPADGTIISGTSAIDESMITGESIPVERGTSDRVIGGSMNTLGSFTARATAVGADTVLAGIIRSVEAAQSSKAPIQRMADRISGVFVPVVVVAALITYVVWLVADPSADPTGRPLMLAISVLVIACPCALGLATPTAIIAGTGAAARRGILFSNAASLERLESVDTIVLDKTGTLTMGQPRVQQWTQIDHPRLDQSHALNLVRTLEHHSEHPLAHALRNWCETAGAQLLSAADVRTIPGRGTTGNVGGHRVRIGSAALMSDSLLLIPETLQAAADADTQAGLTSVFVSIDGSVCMNFGIADDLRPESAEVVNSLRASGHRIIMLTGDRQEAAAAIAARLGIEDFVHSVTPDGKRDAIATLQRRGSVVAMVGDGINDAPCLAQADVGIAVGSAADMAKTSADLTLMRNDLRSIVDARLISASTMRVIRQNFILAFIYNVLGIPLAAGALIPLLGLQLTPMYAAFAMAMSSVTVVTNSLRLRSRG